VLVALALAADSSVWCVHKQAKNVYIIQVKNKKASKKKSEKEKRRKCLASNTTTAAAALVVS